MIVAPIKETIADKSVLTKEQQIERYGLEINKVYNEDCLVGMQKIKDKSIDMILCDLPYGTTQNKWDSVIPLNDYIEVETKGKIKQLKEDEYLLYCYKNNISLEEAKKEWKNKYKQGLWTHYNRIIKDRGIIVLTSDGIFTSELTNSNKKMFKYKLIWDKKSTTGFLNAKRMPLRRHEDILVFYKKTPNYFPKMEIRGKPRIKGGYHDKRQGNGDMCYGEFKSQTKKSNEYYPTSIIQISNANQSDKMHPTQKPIDLFKYLIETYTKKDDLILDNCIGSGTTAMASIGTERNFIGYELNNEYYKYSNERIMSAECK